MKISFIGSDSDSAGDYIDSENNRTYRSELTGSVITITDLTDNSIVLTVTMIAQLI